MATADDDFTTPPPQARSRTAERRRQFLDRPKKRALPEILMALEPELLDDGWRAIPAVLTLEHVKKRYRRRTLVGKNRAFADKDDFARATLNHCTRSYSLENTHSASLSLIFEILEARVGDRPLDVLREVVRQSSLRSMQEMLSSNSWISSLTDRVSSASRGEPRRLWSLPESPATAFAGIYTALLEALGYNVPRRQVLRLSWDIAAIAEGLCLAERTRHRPGSYRVRMVGSGAKLGFTRRAVDPTGDRWPLLGFLIMRLLEPLLGSTEAPNEVPSSARSVFEAQIREHMAFVVAPPDVADAS